MVQPFHPGLREGDIVHAIDGAEITQWPDVVEIIRKNPEKELIFQSNVMERK